MYDSKKALEAARYSSLEAVEVVERMQYVGIFVLGKGYWVWGGLGMQGAWCGVYAV